MLDIEIINPKTLVRFWSKVEKTNSCWIWIACKNKEGYGRFRLNGKTIYAHTFSYELFSGKISNELEIDHLCRNRKCANPDHLESVLHKENIKRGNTGVINKEKTHCLRDHPLSGENLYVTPEGKRHCKKCQIVAKHNFVLRGRI